MNDNDFMTQVIMEMTTEELCALSEGMQEDVELESKVSHRNPKSKKKETMEVSK